MKRQNLCALLVLASNCLVLFLLFSWNDYWCRHGIYFYLPGLFFLFGSTRLSNRNGAIVAFITGLLIDSTSTSSFGLHAFGLTLCHLIAREGGEGMKSTRSLRPHISTVRKSFSYHCCFHLKLSAISRNSHSRTGTTFHRHHCITTPFDPGGSLVSCLPKQPSPI